MNTSSYLKEEDVRHLAKEVLGRMPAPYQGAEIIVRATPNFDGDDALYVTAVFPDGADQLSGPAEVELQIQLDGLLMARGDYRLLYLSTLTRSDFEDLMMFEAEGPRDAS